MVAASDWIWTAMWWVTPLDVADSESGDTESGHSYEQPVDIYAHCSQLAAEGNSRTEYMHRILLLSLPGTTRATVGAERVSRASAVRGCTPTAQRDSLLYAVLSLALRSLGCLAGAG